MHGVVVGRSCFFERVIGRNAGDACAVACYYRFKAVPGLAIALMSVAIEHGLALCFSLLCVFAHDLDSLCIAKVGGDQGFVQVLKFGCQDEKAFVRLVQDFVHFEFFDAMNRNAIVRLNGFVSYSNEASRVAFMAYSSGG